MLEKLKKDYSIAYDLGISTNPILHSFQITVKEYNIPNEYIENFLKSMSADLEKKEYKTKEEANDYIYGSADVVGLMCLKIFWLTLIFWGLSEKFIKSEKEKLSISNTS